MMISPSKTKLEELIDQLIFLTEYDYISWMEKSGKYTECDAYETEVLGGTLILHLVPEHKVRLEVKYEGYETLFYHKKFMILHDAIRYKMYTPWDIQDYVDKIRKWDGEEKDGVK